MQKGNFLGANVGVHQIVQKSYETGERRYVAVDLASMPLVYPPIGGRLINPFGVGGKIFEGDLCEISYASESEIGQIKVLKVYKVAVAVTDSDTTVKIIRDDAWGHKLESNQILMKAPSTLSGTGKAVNIGTVTESTTTIDNVATPTYTITITANALGALSAGDILVEAVEAGAGKKMLVSNPNSFFPNDITFNYPVINGTDPFSGSFLLFTPVIRGVYWKHRMRPIPACVEARNKTHIGGWFEL